MEDNYYYKGLRKRLVEELRKKGITDARILAAMQALPRHFFLPKGFEEQAYEDKPFPIDEGQTISQPYTVAYQTQLLGLRQGDKVLEVGTGSGYQAAILALMGAKVYSLERIPALYRQATSLLKKLNIRGVRTYLRDGFEGLPEYAPFDKILITAAAAKIPEKLLQQLKPGGRMVVPTGPPETQYMYVIDRLSANEYRTEKKGRFRFVPMLKGLKKNKKNTNARQ